VHVTRESIDHTLQRVLVPVYAFCIASGVAAWIWQPPAFEHAVSNDWLIRVWSVFMVTGSLACFVGTLIPRGAEGDWFGEFIGLPLVGCAVAMFAAVALKVTPDQRGYIAGICLALAMSFLVWARWLRVRDDARKQRGRKPEPPTSATN